MKNNQRGGVAGGVATFIGLLFFLSLFCVSFKGSQSEVSGIVYNTEINHFLTGKTRFSVRAGIDTYVSDSNTSDFCLPPHSQYEELVEKAAADKTIKVDVTANKYFAFQAPWTCRANVVVTQVK